jgi:hypothetical protein
VIEIEAKKAGTINEKTFGKGCVGGQAASGNYLISAIFVVFSPGY